MSILLEVQLEAHSVATGAVEWVVSLARSAYA